MLFVTERSDKRVKLCVWTENCVFNGYSEICDIFLTCRINSKMDSLKKQKDLPTVLEGRRPKSRYERVGFP